MKLRVLGSAAGGGFPQWNCNCTNCRDVRLGVAGLRARTQSSLAVSATGKDWLLLNASPDLRQQLAAAPYLQPAADGPLRHSPIAAVLLTNADVDHTAGLLNLREGQPLGLYGSDRVLAALAANSIFRVLADGVVHRRQIRMHEWFEPHRPGDLTPEPDGGLGVEAFTVPGKIALYLEDTSRGAGLGTDDGDTIGVEIRSSQSGKRACYIPGCAAIDDRLSSRLRGADVVFFDGTLFSDDEMIRAGLSQKTGLRMGHISMSGPQGSMAALANLNIGQRIYIHINNSNPVLRETSAEHRAVRDAGWQVAYDGMEIEL